MKNTSHPAIVFNCSYNGLSIIQELGAKGVPCIAMDYVPAVGVFSKYARFKRCPNPLKNEKGFIKYLINLCIRQPKKPVLFPTNDIWARLTAKYKDDLAEFAYPCVANYNVVNLLLDKSCFYKTGAQKLYMTPETWSFNEVQKIGSGQFPIVAKAKYKTVPHEAYTPEINKKLKSHRFSIIDNSDSLSTFREENKEMAKHLIFQEYITGMSDAMYTVGIYVDANHNIKALFTGKKVRGFPAKAGDAIVGQSHRLPQALIANTARIVKEAGYCGIAEFEYKKDGSSQVYKLIEVNPRSWSWIGITPACGVNIPYIAYRDLIGENVRAVYSDAKTAEVTYIKIYQDIVNCLFRYRSNHRQWAKSLFEWRSDIKSGKLVIAEYNKGDWPILFASVIYLIAKILTAGRR